MCWGFFKKLVIADNVGVIANKVFALADPSFEMLWAGVFAFAIQIYADFSAYTDIARGASRWLGIELTENFDHPYLARTPSDFWRRWNISLSTWFRDYVYIPLGGSTRDRVALGAQRAGDVPALRALARRELELRAVGPVSRPAARDHRAHRLLRPAARRVARVDGAWPQTVGMFALTLIGWLLFRETDLPAIVRDLRLVPWHSTPLDRQVGAVSAFC